MFSSYGYVQENLHILMEKYKEENEYSQNDIDYLNQRKNEAIACKPEKNKLEKLEKNKAKKNNINNAYNYSKSSNSQTYSESTKCTYGLGLYSKKVYAPKKVKIPDDEAAIWRKAGETGEGIFVGRQKNCELRLAYGFVSNRHALVNADVNGVYVTDLNSTNGTKVNGEKIPANVKMKCKNNDIISFAGIEYRVIWNDIK